jgi:hypothetical protein
MFRWVTKNHEIVTGISRVKHNKCKSCGETIPKGNTLCDVCFEKEKEVSQK